VVKIADIFSSLPSFETERLLLRKMVLNDAGDLFEYASDEKVAEFVLWERHLSIEDSKRYLCYMIEKYDNQDVSEWGMVHKQSGKFIGTCGYMWWNTLHRRAEIGYALSRKYWNRGLMTEAVREVVTFGFEKMKLNRIEVRCMLANIASEKVLKKVGMKCEGIMKKQAFAKGSFHDLKMYAILREEYLLR
jgi:ribosomal-protein-alanine N-acetyltransferase